MRVGAAWGGAPEELGTGSSVSWVPGRMKGRGYVYWGAGRIGGQELKFVGSRLIALSPGSRVKLGRGARGPVWWASDFIGMSLEIQI